MNRKLQSGSVGESPAPATPNAKAYKFVEENWVSLWRRINAGGLVQHQCELAKILCEFMEAANG